VIDQLGRARDPAHPKDDGLFRVDYRDLAVQQLGGVYEGLLELVPKYASTRMVVVRQLRGDRRTERVLPASDLVPDGFEATARFYPENSVYLETDKGERREYGSYYTPDHIVAHITQNTLEPLCTEISRRLDAEIANIRQELQVAGGDTRTELEQHLEALQKDFGNRVLNLRVLDPAMGSGHFLVRACQYLAEEIATNPHTDDDEANRQTNDESTLTYWKRRVVESCIFGVDLNPMAVELAKLSLWLDTVAVGYPLSFLDHHLHVGNSLIGARLRDLGSLPDAPPIVENQFGAAYQQRIAGLVATLTRIQRMPSDTTPHVKEKARLLRTQFRPLSESFRIVADLWCSTFFTPKGQQVAPEVYDDAVLRLGRRGALKQISELVDVNGLEAALVSVRQGVVRCFHWELEFPDIFGSTGADRGFDAIIGNPPYDVLSEKEQNRDLTEFKDYIAKNPVYEPSRRKGSKNNLYKLFLCRMLDLAKEDGRIGVITPMALLGDEAASDLRRALVRDGTFTRVDAFPQKDDPRKRVFIDAKLSTCVVDYLKTNDQEKRRASFRSQVHPAERVEPSSPGLTLSTASIPLYDPSNFTIVSCSQADWDIATRIMKTGRLGRLRRYVEFSQGEVNETKQREAGNLCGANEGRQVLRGANICLYVTRPASQGRDFFLDVDRFLEKAGEEAKAHHHRYRRVGVQESSPQNNFRRIIASLIPAGEFCNHKINYVPEHKSKLPLGFVAALLNSELADWYFRLGSTNAAVSHYQLENLPCPLFHGEEEANEHASIEAAHGLIRENDIDAVRRLLQDLIGEPPFESAITEIIAAVVERIAMCERNRGEITRTARSALAEEAQPWQDVLNEVFYAMAGIDTAERQGLATRLQAML
jgi:hypothetical protein